MIQLIALLVAQAVIQDGQPVVQGGVFSFSDKPAAAPAITIENPRVWLYSKILREYLPLLKFEIQNHSQVSWRRFEMLLVLDGELKEGTLEFKQDFTVKPGQTLTLSQGFDRVALQSFGDIKGLTVEITAAEREQQTRFRGFEGLVMLAPDCAQDYRAIQASTGVNLRSRLLQFTTLGCGKLVEDMMEVRPTGKPAPPGFIAANFFEDPDYPPQLSGWIPVNSIKNGTRLTFARTKVHMLGN